MKVAKNAGEVEDAYRLARSEAKAAFGNDEVYMEKYLGRPRHIEVQLLADGQGGSIHLGERDCSLQRRHQKLLEEALSPALNAAERETIGPRVATAIRELGYRSAGTIEFLYADGEFYFLEMKPTLQVKITQEKRR